MRRYVVMTAAAHMPSSCRGTYRRVALVETDLPAPELPLRIDARWRGVTQIVRTWEGLNVGKTERCAYRKALVEAEAMADRLNATERLNDMAQKLLGAA